MAIITGISLILMTVLAGYSFGYGFSEFYQTDQLISLKSNINNNQSLYKSMLIGILLILILDLLVSYTLFRYFKAENKKTSLVSGLLRVLYTFIFGFASLYLIKNLNTNEISNKLLNENFETFQSIWNCGLIIFGFHITLIGILMKLHKNIPKTLWSLTLFAGMCYIIVHILKLTNPNTEFVMNLEMILALPMAIGEIGLAIWLLIKGGKK
jgi:hypothetical protein